MKVSKRSLPSFTAEDWNWRMKAACHQVEPGTFFAADGERCQRKRRREARAKSVCFACPVRSECLDWAMTVGEMYGVWGGLTPEERSAGLNRDLPIAN